RHEFIVRRLQQSKRQWRDGRDQSSGAESWLVRRTMGQIDQRILPPPRKLVVVGKPKTDDAAEHSLRFWIGGCEHRQPGALGHTDENRLASCGRGGKRSK